MTRNNKFELKTNRIEGLCDGIFAIAMTILILSFENLLAPPKFVDEPVLINMISGLGPDFLHYVISFIILGIFWIQHHRQFHFIRYSDTKLLFLNILGLMFIALIPFSTVMAGDYGEIKIASLFFEFNLLIAGLVFYVHWVYAVSRHRLVDADLEKDLINFYNIQNLMIPAVSIIAIFVSIFINPRWGTLLYFVVPFIMLIYQHKTER